jgi:ribosomal protein L30/L7E
VTLAQIDLDYLDRVRSRMQTLSNRREDVYALRLNRGEAGKI